MTALIFLTKEQEKISAYSNAASVEGVTSADNALQTTYVAFIKMLNAKVSLHRGFIYLNRFMNYDLQSWTEEIFSEFNGKLEEYITHVAQQDYESARESHNYIIAKLDDSDFFLQISRASGFTPSDFTSGENTDGNIISMMTTSIDNTGEPIFGQPNAEEQ